MGSRNKEIQLFDTGLKTEDGRPVMSYDKEGKSRKEEKKYADGNYYGVYPGFLHRLALRSMFGFLKYGDRRGWRHPRPSSTYMDSVQRHLNQYNMGDNTEDHLAAVTWNIQAIMYNEEHAKQFHDIEERKGKSADYTHNSSKSDRDIS